MTDINLLSFDDYDMEGAAISRLCLDIEAAPCQPEDIKIEQSVIKASGNFKDTKTGTAEEKKAAQIEAKKERVYEDDGLLDMNPIACIGIEADGELFHFSWMTYSEQELQKLVDFPCSMFVHENEANMLKGFRSFCNNHCNENTVSLSWNGYSYDLNHIRFRYAVLDIGLPEIFHPDAHNRHVDLMERYCSRFTIDKNAKAMVSQSTVCKKLKIDSNVKEGSITGENFLKAFSDGKHFGCTIYNLGDINDLSRIGRRMGY